jgi:glutamate-1-semialdehyde 2,1-aminomutase
MKRLNLPKLLHEKGTALRDGLIAEAKRHGYELRISGMPALFYLRLVDPQPPEEAPGTPSLMFHQRWIAEMVKRGIYVTNHHNHFINYALTDEDIKTTIAVAGEAFSVL